MNATENRGLFNFDGITSWKLECLLETAYYHKEVAHAGRIKTELAKRAALTESARCYRGDNINGR